MFARVKGVASKGVRLGNWLSLKQAQALLNAPDITTRKGLRDRAIIAVLLGCGLRRSEVAALTLKHIQQRDGRWCIVDLVGKHGRVRTVPMPTWVKVAIDTWTIPASMVDGHVFRSVTRGGQVQEHALSEKVVWQMLRPYAAAAGVPGIAPHDCRRTAAKLCGAAGGELEQIQMLLGHASVQTTERYLGTKQALVHAPNDWIKLRVAWLIVGRFSSDYVWPVLGDYRGDAAVRHRENSGRILEQCATGSALAHCRTGRCLQLDQRQTDHTIIRDSPEVWAGE
jgi:integrase